MQRFHACCPPVHQVEAPSCDPSVMSSHRMTHDKAGLLPEVEDVDGVTALTDRGRYQVDLQGAAKKVDP